MELAARISGQKRDVEYALMTVEQAAQKVSIDEEEVNSYYDASPRGICDAGDRLCGIYPVAPGGFLSRDRGE